MADVSDKGKSRPLREASDSRLFPDVLELYVRTGNRCPAPRRAGRQHGVFAKLMNRSLGTREIFESSADSRLVRKYSNYFEIYDRFFERYRSKRPRLLEIGVQHGGSLDLWNIFFAGEVDIVGIDILPECAKFAADNVRIFIGDQSDDAFLRRVLVETGKFDIIVDDGSHIPSHQIRSFETLFFDGLADDGVYLCEDCHGSYWKSYGGGLRRRGSFIEYAKRLCDQVNAWHANLPGLPIDRATRWIKSITFFSSVVVFEKTPMESPASLSAGVEAISLEAPFARTEHGALILALKRNAWIQSLVRRHPTLWKIMRSRLR
jgi:hypothetical protein